LIDATNFFIAKYDQESDTIEYVADLAANLCMATVSEGIESIEDAELLQKMGCLYGQGYYYAKPMSAENMKQYIINSGFNKVS